MGTIYVLISAFFFSLGGLLIKLIPWSSVSINGSRCFLAFFVMLAYLKISGRKFVFNRAVVLIAVCNATMSLTFVMATKMTSAANAIVLQFTEPIFMILLLWIFFKVRPRRPEILACAVAFSGMIFFFLDKLSPSGMAGNLLAIFSGLTYCCVFLSKKIPGGDMESAMIVSFVISFLVGLPSITRETDWSLQTLLLITALGVVQYTFAYIFLSKGLEKVSPITASLTSMIEPILNPIWVAIFYHERIGRFAFLGAILIISATVGYQVYTARQEQPA